ncbi:MAG: putative ATPase, partial [Halothiobacillaceae bacterium]
LPFIGDGTLTFIGATTENPSFELNNALLSRARVYVLKRLTTAELLTVLQQALTDAERGLGGLQLNITSEQCERIAQAADGDARRALNLLEISADLAESGAVSDELLNEVLSGGVRRFDKGGEAFYDQISALHKSVRGSSPDGALYWLCRMIDGGCDPLYIARRVVRMASEESTWPAPPRVTPSTWPTTTPWRTPNGWAHSMSPSTCATPQPA